MTMSQINIGDPVHHIKSRKDGILKTINNGLAEIRLTGGDFDNSEEEYIHLCLVENLIPKPS